jgi:hypothetical protein
MATWKVRRPSASDGRKNPSRLASQFGAFFRDPIDRTMSHYFYTERMHIDPVEFAAQVASFYHRCLGEVAVEDLAYVGITEEFDLSCQLFTAVFGRKLTVRHDRKGDGIDYRAWLSERNALEGVPAHTGRQSRDLRRRSQTLRCTLPHPSISSCEGVAGLRV